MKTANFLRVASNFNPDEYLKQASRAMASRPAKVIFDVLSPMPSHLLNVSLAGHLPLNYQPAHFHDKLESYNSQRKELAKAIANGPDGLPAAPPVTFGPALRCPWPLDTSLPKDLQSRREICLTMPIGHHLVYFPPQIPGSGLAPDGADADHCPGAPFVRRLWAGGSLTFSEGWEKDLSLDGRRAVCIETVEPPSLRADGGGPSSRADKVFVDVVRRYGPVMAERNSGPTADAKTVGDTRDRPVIQEVRKLVFLRESEASSKGEVVGGLRRVVRAIHEPDFSFSFVPDARLLFHFSALTFNAHAIHIDPLYAREREGHRNILVHGPLSLALMLAALRHRVSNPWRLASFDYKNVAPLYAGEEVKVCVRASPGEGGRDSRKWNVWVEGPDGSLAVRGTAIAVKRVIEETATTAERAVTIDEEGVATDEEIAAKREAKRARKAARKAAKKAANEAAIEAANEEAEATTEEAEATTEDAGATAWEGVATAGEEAATTKEAEVTAREGAAITKEVEGNSEWEAATAEEAETTAREGVVTAGEVEATAEEAETTAGEEVVTAGEVEATVGEPETIAGEGISTAEEAEAEATTRKAEAAAREAEATAGKGAVAAGEVEATAEEAEIIAREGMWTAEEAEAIAGEGVATAGEVEATDEGGAAKRSTLSRSVEGIARPRAEALTLTARWRVYGQPHIRAAGEAANEEAEATTTGNAEAAADEGAAKPPALSKTAKRRAQRNRQAARNAAGAAISPVKIPAKKTWSLADREGILATNKAKAGWGAEGSATAVPANSRGKGVKTW